MQLVNSRILQDTYHRIAPKDRWKDLDHFNRLRPASRHPPTQLLLQWQIILIKGHLVNQLRHNHRSPLRNKRISRQASNHTYHRLTILVLARHLPTRTLVPQLFHHIVQHLDHPHPFKHLAIQVLVEGSRQIMVTHLTFLLPPHHPVSPLLTIIRLRDQVLHT